MKIGQKGLSTVAIAGIVVAIVVVIAVAAVLLPKLGTPTTPGGTTTTALGMITTTTTTHTTTTTPIATTTATPTTISITTTSAGQPLDGPFEWVSDIKPGSGAGTPPGGSTQDGPWNHRVMSATSSDGLSWVKDNIIIADQASVPDAVLGKDGIIRVYYVDWYNGGLSVALSHDGVNWIYKKVVGISPEWVDPDVILTPDGKYRLYASYMPVGGPQDKILSAISNYGVSFAQEEGVRYQEESITDPDVIKMGGNWRMFVSKGPTTISTISSDGLTFTREGELPISGSVTNTIAVENGYRIYFHSGAVGGGMKILCAFSADGRTWENAVQVLEGGPQGSLDQKGVADPTVIKLPNGIYKMFYKTWIE
jgi:hypothetical protein